MSDKDKGLYIKYHMTHADGTPVDPDGKYFVLKFNSMDANHRQACQVAGAAYAAAIRDSIPKLAADLQDLLYASNGIPIEDEEKIVDAAQNHFYYEEDKINIDYHARISMSEHATGHHGAWVQAWVFFPIEHWPEELKEKYETYAENANDCMD